MERSVWSSSCSAAVLLFAAAILGACDEGRCARTSDCASGLECRAGTCAEPPIDGDAAAEAQTDAASPAPDAAQDAPDAAQDARDATAPTDAGHDGAPAEDAGADASVTENQEDDGGGPSDLDAGADASP